MISLCLLCSAVACDDRSPQSPPEAGPASLLWTYPIDVRTGVPSSDGERVYLTGPGAVVVLDARSGEELWEFSRPTGGFAEPRVVAALDRVVISWGGRMHGFGAEDGVERWTLESPLASLASDGRDGVYATNRDRIARIDPRTGDILWMIDPADPRGFALAVDSDAVCARTAPILTVRCFAEADGSLLWDSGQIGITRLGGVKIVDSRVLVEDRDSWIAFDLHSGNEIWRRSGLLDLSTAAVGSAGVVYACDRLIGSCKAVRSDDGSVLWEANPTAPGNPAASEDFVFVVDNSEQSPAVSVLDPATGAVVDSIRTADPGGFSFPPVYEGELLFAASSSKIYAYKYP